MRVFEYKVLRRIPGLGGGGGDSWIKLHNEELRDFYFSSHIIQVIK
jgi:hypothetical protein